MEVLDIRASGRSGGESELQERPMVVGNLLPVTGGSRYLLFFLVILAFGMKAPNGKNVFFGGIFVSLLLSWDNAEL
jgi:hypothetical protein